MPIPSAFVTRFFQLVRKRQFAEAERELQRLRERMQKNEWNKGYNKALNGILSARKTNADQYSFLENINLKDTEMLKQYRRDFMRQVKSKLHAEYDRGFFSAWSDFLRVALKTQPTKKPEKKTQPTKKPEKKTQPTVISEQGEKLTSSRGQTQINDF